MRWVIAHQGAFFFPILLLEGLSLHASSVHRVLAREPIAHRPVEITFLAVRIVGYLALVFLVLSPDKAAVFLAIQLGLFGFYMGMSFAPNHKGMPLVPKGMKLDFLRRQVLMSRNIRGTPFLDFMMGGLNYQIEHHLFPSMPRPHLRRAAPIIAAYLPRTRRDRTRRRPCGSRTGSCYGTSTGSGSASATRSSARSSCSAPASEPSPERIPEALRRPFADRCGPAMTVA